MDKELRPINVMLEQKSTIKGICGKVNGVFEEYGEFARTIVVDGEYYKKRAIEFAESEAEVPGIAGEIARADFRAILQN